MKKVLLVSQSQDGSYINILNHSLKELNAELTVISGKLPSDIDEDVQKIQSVKYDSTSFASRFKTWRSYVNDAASYIKDHIDDYDLFVFTSNPPVNQKLVKIVQKKKKRCVYLVWDIYPNTIEKAFGSAIAPLAYLWRKANDRLYRKCDRVLTIGEVMKEVLENDYPGLDVQVIPYHTDTGFIHPIDSSENPFIRDQRLEGKTVLMYSGKMGFGHGFNEILGATEILKDRRDIQFVLIGFGAAYEDVKNYVREHGLRNTTVLPYQPLEMLPYSLGSADIAFITIKAKNDGLFLPSKVYDAMASGSAIICISDGKNDVSRLIEDNHMGVNIGAGNMEGLAEAIAALVDDQQRLKDYKRNARNAAEKYDVEKITLRYKDFFAQLV